MNGTGIFSAHLLDSARNDPYTTMALRTSNEWDQFSPQANIRRKVLGLPDLAVGMGAFALLSLIGYYGAHSLVAFRPPDVIPSVSLDPRNLPNYAARSAMRMFIALIASTLFTFVYGYAAARSKRAERVLIPMLDILQSVPVLGFLSITVDGFIALFRGSLLGLEAASIFAVFTSQAWNMTYSFYQSLQTLPRELDEMAAMYRLSAWERFTRLELPASMIGLVWNAMMSFGGGWFFLSASEAISVLNREYTLPGVGSYVAAAIEAQDSHAIGWAILTMILMIVVIDQLVWKPLVTIADKYKMELSAGEERRSWLVNAGRSASLPQYVRRILGPVPEMLDRALASVTAVPTRTHRDAPSRAVDLVYNIILMLVAVGTVAAVSQYVLSKVGFGEVLHVAKLGFVTGARVVVLLILSTLVWTPLAVAIGFSPRLTKIFQPVVQILASFPANFLFPFATLAFIKTGVSLNWGSILLMALGAQWYILFNVIGGAQSVPNDLREMAASFGLRGSRAWRTLIGPGIFGTWVTGAITASGGAWNASIVSELVSWGDTHLRAYGLGAYIEEATRKGDWPRIVLGVAMMSIYVVGLNRAVWRPLYSLAENKYRLD